MSTVEIIRSGSGVRAASSTGREHSPTGVRILRAGVCGTDLQIARGDRSDTARILGHEAVGCVGDRSRRLVVFNPVDPSNQDCILGHSYDGVFRPYVPLDGWPRPALVEIPAGLTLELATLCEPVAAALFGWELVDAACRPAAIGIWGAGAMGMIHALVALRRGGNVHVVHPRAPRLAWARRQLFGSAVHCHATGSTVPQKLDVAVLCTDHAGARQAVEEAVAAVRPDGLIVVVGGIPQTYAHRCLPGVDLGFVRRRNVGGRLAADGIVRTTARTGKRLRVTGHRGTAARQLLAAHALLGSETAYLSRLITHLVEPADAVELMNARCAGAEQDHLGAEIVKIVVRFGELDDTGSRDG